MFSAYKNVITNVRLRCVMKYIREQHILLVFLCLSVYNVHMIKTKTVETKNFQTWHRNSPSRYIVHQLILGQKVKGQGRRVTKCKKAIEWPA